MSRLSEIYEGWKNVIFPTPEIEEMAKERISVCVECENLNILNICSKCCCPHIGKAHSPESRCTENRWRDGWGKNEREEERMREGKMEEMKPNIMLWNEELQDWEDERVKKEREGRLFPWEDM